ncbi:hypothetical protein [Dactylosporangium sp. NPDC048998]|uniref:hypothetical protein n=1 Tax=Dactylosporangium sp. NPDC048998 TaxID=3363976 RepID=UPI003721ACA8
MEPDLPVDLPAPRDLPPHRRDARVALLELHVTTPRRLVPARLRRPRLLVAAGLGAALLLSSGAIAYRQWAPAAVRDQVRCYTVDSLRGGDDFFGTTAGQAQPANGPALPPPSPVEVCAGLWRAGVLRPGVKQVSGPPGGEYPVPPLVACALPDGVAAVFPGDERTCLRLGLPRLSE